MSDITLRVKADFEEARKAFADLANSSDEIKKKIEKFSDSFKTEKINKFIDRQKLLEVSMRGTRGETLAMQQAASNYGREIERLIKSGLSPKSNAIQRLTSEYEKLGNKIDVSIAKEKAENDILRATKSSYEAIGARIAVLVLATQKTAEMGAMIEDTSKKIGMTGEKFQELDYAAKMTGVNNLDKHLEKLNKSIIDVGNGTGTLTKYLTDNDKQLLNQLKNVSSNEEAFMLLMGAINNTQDPLEKAEIAMAAFGKSGQEMLLMAEGGTGEINKLGEEARKYGILSNEAVTQSGLFMDAQDRLKQSVQGVGIELSEKLMPGLTDVITKAADFIASIDDWEGVLTNAGVAVGIATTALTTFIAVSKGHEIITKMGIAIKGFMAAVSGPAGIAALAIGGLAAVITILVKRQNEMATAGEREAAKMKKTSDEANKLLTEYNKLNTGKALDLETSKKLIALYPGLIDKIDITTASVDDYTKAIKELNEQKAQEASGEWIKKIDDANKHITEFTTRIEELKGMDTEKSKAMGWDNEGEIKDLDEMINHEKTLITKAVDQINAIFATVGKEYKDGAIVDIPVTVTPVTTTTPEIDTPATPDEPEPDTKKEKTLQQRLKELNPDYEQNDDISQIQSYLQQRAELETEASDNRLALQQNELDEKLNAENISLENIKALYAQRGELEQAAIEERKLAIEEEAARILESETITDEEKLAAKIARDELIHELNVEAGNKKIALEKEVNDKITKMQGDAAETEKKLLKDKLTAMASFVGSISQLFSVLGNENKAMAKAGAAIAMVEAGINSALAFTDVLAREKTPAALKLISAGAVLAAGLAQQVSIGQQIASMETGGRFIVPNSTGVDSQIMRVNAGEEINVTPRGMVDGEGEAFNFQFNFEGSQFASIINKLARRGELYQLQLAGNL